MSLVERTSLQPGRVASAGVSTSPKEWHAAKAQFAIQFGDRFALTV